MTRPPCLQCTKRKLRCHGSCKEYVGFRLASKVEKERQKETVYYSKTKEKIMRRKMLGI